MTPRKARLTGEGFIATLGVLALTILVWGRAVPAPSQSAPTAQKSGEELFVEQIQPLFEKQCKVCHSGEMAQSGLDVSSRTGLLKGGGRGPAIVPGDPKASLLYKLVAHEIEPGMPPGGQDSQLPKDLVARIAAWIQAGAPYVGQAREGGLSDAGGARDAKPAAGAEVEPGNADFDEHIRPVLEAQCLTCHGANNVTRAGLDLSTRETLLRGGDNGPVVVSGKAADSLLLKRIKHEIQPGMPYKGEKLSADVIGRIAAWIDAGAPYSEKPLHLSGGSQVISESGNTHWAFQRPIRPAVPPVKNAAWVRNPIDAFIAAEHEKRGLKPLPEAEKRVLLRRVYVDLIGLPPTSAEMGAFLADRSANAYEKVVDQLLADPRYGERWGRHWMDVWRYSDPDGFAGRVDYSQAHIWRWRDWIIESMNQDKSYDRMVTEMLAGDELAPTDPQTLRATGYLARSWYRFNRHSWLQDTVDHTAAAFLGVTLRCARCHEHKYDPFQQEEYYRFRAFFEPYDVRTDQVPGETDINKNGLPRAYEAEPREALPDEENSGVLLPAIFGETRRLIRGEETNPDEHVLTPAVPKALGGISIDIQPVELPIEASYPALRSFVQEDLLKVATAEIGKAEANLDRANRLLTRAKERALRASRDQAAPGAASGGESSAESTSVGAGEVVSFEKDVKPIFEESCFACHNAQTLRSGLSLETVESIMAGGNRNGPAVIPRSTEESPLLQYLRGEKKPRMPVGGEPLREDQMVLIGNWINQLPEEDPETVLRKAEVDLVLAEKELAWARANLPALEARIAADVAKFKPSPSVDAEVLAQTARRAERQAHLLKAGANLIQAQRKLSDALSGPAPADDKADKDREKKISTARREVEAAQKALGLSTEKHTPIGRIYTAHSSGRRTALARWIVSPENPLTARVAVNHLWLRHFGKALVPTVENFGVSGAAPSNPQLLDWLAVEFMEKNWSMKAMHRLMVTSSTYRMQSATRSAKDPNLSADVDNRYLWRMNPRRMEAESVRDSVLYLAGQLDTTIGGPDEKDINSPRRGMYFKQTPYGQIEFLKLFDVANPAECYQRSESIVPQQALALANSTLSLTMARKLAQGLSRQVDGKDGPSAFVAAAFESVLGRPPSAAESAKTVEFLREQADLLRDSGKLTSFGVSSPGEIQPASDPEMRARENLVHVLFNHNEFVMVR